MEPVARNWTRFWNRTKSLEALALLVLALLGSLARGTGSPYWYDILALYIWWGTWFAVFAWKRQLGSGLPSQPARRIFHEDVYESLNSLAKAVDGRFNVLLAYYFLAGAWVGAFVWASWYMFFERSQ